MTPEARDRLRGEGKALRLGLSDAERQAYSLRIASRLVALLDAHHAANVALFWPIVEAGEVDLRALDATLQLRGTARFYPFQEHTPQGLRRGFRQLVANKRLSSQGKALFAQPDSQAPLAEPGQLDLIVVPALVATRKGQRLGYGSGFYDRVIPLHRPPARAVIAAFEAQCVPDLPPLPHDVRCDGMVTERGTYGCSALEE